LRTSNLDRGRFPVYLKPGEAGKKQDHIAKSGPKADPDLKAKIDLALSTPGSLQDKADGVNGMFGTNHDRSTISRWLKKPSLNFDEDKQKGEAK